MAVKTFYLSSLNSDLSGGADFNKKLVEAVESASSIVMSVAAGATEDSYFFTEPGVPGPGGATGDYSVEVNVLSAPVNTGRAAISVGWSRVNSSGVVQSSSSFTAEQDANPVAIKTFSATGVNLGTWAAGDRLRITVRLRELTGMGAQSVTIGTGTTSEEAVTPFTADNDDEAMLAALDAA